MPDDAASSASHSADSRPSDIHLARAQIEAARVRQHRLVANGQLPPVAPALGGSRPSLSSARPPPTSLPGYALLRELHRGGQGIVYLAVQESTERHVAIKVLNRELPAAAGSDGLARFEREIEILSRLKHPNIVTVHDCGRDHGHVFLVMDYVIGQPLDAWAKQLPSPSESEDMLKQVLGVFAKICDGVNAAHLRGVIHRDLKPGNILVDERGEPHVLDFGLAKLVEDPDARGDRVDRAMTTTGQFVGSLPWASPEQAQGRSDALDIRTDVYSLGVIFYQLLTGEFPYPIAGPLNEVVGHIVESDPVRPSTIERDIDRELETILLKCLAKEPERRYQSAGEVARDIRRYLAGEAIEARRDSLVYLMRKRLARYRVAALGAAAMLVIVLSALIISIVSWNQAARQRIIAQENESAAHESAAQARAVTDFMREIMTSVEPENQGADVRLIEVLERASAEASQRFAGHPEQEAQVRDLFGQVYDTLTMWTEAMAEYARAEDLWRDSAGADDPRTLDTQARRALAMINVAQTDGAERVLGDLVPRLERRYGPDDPRTLAAYRNIALTHLLRGREDEAQQLLDRLRAHPRLVDDDEAQMGIVHGLINVHVRNMATFDVERRRASLQQAEPLAAELIERATRLYGAGSTKALHSRGTWASIACKLGRFQAAADACRDILEDSAGRLGACHHVRVSAMYTLAEALAGLGEDIAPADLLRQRIECLRGQTAPNSVGMLATLSGAMPFFERAGFAVEGEAMARELCAGLAQYGGGHGEMTPVAEQYLAHFVSMQNRLDEAEPMFRALLEREDELRDAPPGHARLHLFYGLHLVRRGQFEQAEAELKRAVELMGDIRSGTWESHPEDIVLGFIALYEAWGKPESLQEYQRMRDEILRTRGEP